MHAPRRFLALVSLATLAVGAGACDSSTGGDTTDTAAADTIGADAAEDTAAADTSPPITFCEGATTALYDPIAGTDLTVFPDDYWTREATSLTGLRVDIDDDTPWIAEQPALLQAIYLDLAALDGFGTAGGVLLRFSAPLGEVPSGSDASLASPGLMLVALDGETAERVPFESQLLDDNATLVLWPERPLKPKAHYAAVLTNDLLAADGGCVAPSPALRSLLDGTASDAKLAALVPRYAELLDKTGLAPGAISAATVFTTQATVDASRDAAADIAGRSYDWSAQPSCTTASRYRVCEGGTVKIFDYRNEGYLGDPVTPTTYTLPVHVWLPKEGPGPFPVVLYGHGLGGDHSQGAAIASGIAPLGFAVVAVSTLRHGDHPIADPDDPNAFFLDLLGIDLASFTIDGLVFRENLRQASLDKLQVLALLSAHPDIDGDGAADLDLDHVGYFGISLGGIMGSDFLALSDGVGAAVLGLAGGRLISVVTDGEDFSQFKGILVGLIGDPQALDRIAPIAQALIDAGDPVNYAPHVLKDRFAGAPPHILANMAIDDTVVPNVTSRALSRALGLEAVRPIVRPIDLVPDAGKAPTKANLLDASVTGGLFQFDRVSASAGGNPQAATHMNTFGSVEGPWQAFHFFETWIDVGTPEISDPYLQFGTPKL
ncbi:MAG: hypothetical protein EP329_21495 [Deltaproteobacteria bacterium]|nr:MAG: hypothetical protein EP329_21495 [Deltaproteobacteria bacterium]